MKILQCRTNHMPSPIGFAMDHAVVSWIADSTESIRQERAKIIVASDAAMQHILYESDPYDTLDSTGVKLPINLKPRTAYYWTVQVWGDQGDTAVSEVNYFETGKREEPFLGNWITTPWSDKNINPYIRKTFDLSNHITKARLYMTGLGLYWLEINGKRVDDSFFAPGCNAYDHWVQIYTYDVTPFLQQGTNVLGVMMGNGWAKAFFGASREFHKESPMIQDYLLKAELHLTLDDGSEQIITTDSSWKCTPSPVVSDSIYNGEIFDERRVIADWSKAALSDANWDNMNLIVPTDIGETSDRYSIPVTIKEYVKPLAILHTPANELILDMGQNMTGWVRVHVKEPKDTMITLSHGEILQDNCFYRDNLREAKAEYVYISDGSEKTVEPHFTFYGFRYVKLEGFTQEPALEDFIGCAVYSDMDETGYFETSDARINRLFANAKWSNKDNFLDVPTDCPQRDERMGWTGDAQAFCKTACYNVDTYAFYTKYLHDLWTEQKKNSGMVGHVVPSMIRMTTTASSFWNGGACIWGDAAVIMPWIMYTHYGDSTILEAQYPSMKAWIDWILRTYVDADELWSGGFQFGDWLSLDAPPNVGAFGGTDTTYIASVYLTYTSSLLAQTAEVLHMTEDAAYYQEISDRTKAAVQKTYFNEDGSCKIQTQTAQVLALNMNIAEDKATRSKVASDLIALLQSANMHLKTGFSGTAFLCKMLSKEGYSKEAYELLFQKDFPSWLYEVDMGATTIWERWNSVLPNGKISSTGMNSLNHYTYGSIAQWMYENIAGLTLKEAGFKSFYVQPEFTDRFDYVKMSYHSAKGLIQTSWTKENDTTYHLELTVPFDTTAVVPSERDGSLQTLTAGTYHFTYHLFTEK